MAHDKLRSLKCFPELDKKVRAGISCERIATWVQQEKQEYLDASEASLARAVYRYKQDLPATQLADAGLPAHIWKRIEGFQGGIDEVEELEKLYALQLKRLNLALETEEKIRFLNPKLRSEIELAQSLLAQMADTKVKMGKYQPSSNLSVGVEGKVEHSVVGEMEPAQRARLAEATNPLLEALKANLSRIAEQAKQLPAPSDDRGVPDIVEADYEIVGEGEGRG